MKGTTCIRITKLLVLLDHQAGKICSAITIIRMAKLLVWLQSSEWQSYWCSYNHQYDKVTSHNHHDSKVTGVAETVRIVNLLVWLL